MPTKLKNLPKSQVELELIIKGEKIATAYEEEYKKMAPSVTLKGFRPGMAPRNLIEDSLGRDRILQEALNDEIFESYRQAIKEHNLNPISYPEFKLDNLQKEAKLTKDKDLVVKTIVSIRPTAKLGNYQKIKVKRKEPNKVNEKEVKDLIEASFESWKSQQKEAKKKKNEIKVETASSLSEAKQKGIEDKKDDNFLDISKLGEEFTFEDFLKANSVKTREELDIKVTESLSEQKINQEEKNFLNEILEQLVKMTNIDLPEVLIEQELKEMEQSMEAQFKPLGVSFDDYLKHQKKTRDDLKKEWKPQAEKSVKLEFALSEVAKSENIMITDEDINKVLSTVSDEKMRQELEKPEQKVYIKYSLQRDKTIQRLKDLASK
ncbi:hypothetical protein A2X44_02120 [candidate division CPR3 bacterium GWF2_35_18]|uniref:Trigger factor n=1 Tax=candidate division CPR3 bacterium GW2011_GWF2_35_18 TaxID=1618350 RepID=A0A0G0ERJ0_UNCC3|nr:MAG: Trigger factor [candidate division CPR3 bacterium GW2011_GWF2_35_18]KKP85951.1 MAG: Trigger factor [candidate division CPR3 bacterium GW2011_GWE2_35_7]OGB62794.1 MAG: hypothetical protein A2X44_02120 [candidate division CPR3 bacterium GWF2_35_18]OGB65375.1 MAG: hypothetical protein A2250_00335 [candidate division CPR3 bacterium RIFOXYA2_FULL_35_13]OGB78267.1 MAG: hypothetical protein A2296_04330 [candidate division CPR3 bacterium RIFOXYB2_FULL_35_8]OGB80115.1 MAG: hypothetical protein 